MERSFIRKALIISGEIYVIIAVAFFASPFIFQKKEGIGEGGGRLVIPKIGVDARIQTVGTMSDGSIGIPSNATEVAWFAGSSPLGTAGTAVVVGHVDTRTFEAGVFRRLKGLVKGDAIYTFIDGHTARFMVTGSSVYPEGTDRMDEVIGTRTGKARLVLITCDGKWDQSVKRYTDRLVVFADLEPISKVD